MIAGMFQHARPYGIFSFEIHYRTPPVERLSYHLPNEQNVIFNENDSIDSVVNKPSVDRSMFLAWKQCNAKFSKARELRYFEFPEKFVWNRRDHEWTPRKKGFSIGRCTTHHQFQGIDII